MQNDAAADRLQKNLAVFATLTPAQKRAVLKACRAALKAHAQRGDR